MILSTIGVLNKLFNILNILNKLFNILNILNKFPSTRTSHHSQGWWMSREKLK
jgi:hypothetical protein